MGYKSGSTVDGSIYGIYENGAASTTNTIYFNTVSLNGAPTSGAANSYAFYSNSNTNNRDFQNNIFSNTRSNSGATGSHYAAYFNYAVPGTLTMDYNNYYSNGTGSILGYFNSLTVSTLPLISGLDAASISTVPGFSSPIGTTASDFVLSAAMTGTTIAGITVDHNSVVRGVPPTMGAIEYAASLAVRWMNVQAKNTNGAAEISWQVSNEANGTVYIIQHSLNGRDWLEIGKVNARNVSQSNYSYMHYQPQQGKNFYRIVEVASTGVSTYSKIVIVDLSDKSTQVLLLGNPVRTGSVMIQITESSDFSLFTMNGQMLMQKQLEKGWQMVDVHHLAKGNYFVKVGARVAKLVIE